jgi:peptidoglycan/xylan/chitin deacetylase (PgdA/CDA1 family)
VAAARLLKTFGRRSLGLARVRSTATRVAAARGRALILVYHRIAPGADPGGGVVPTVPVDLFRRQLEAILDIGEVVELEALLRAWRGHRPRFAITFDDDYLTHRDVALPVLRELRTPATFFLCGRSLHGMGPAWFDVLDRLVRRDGLEQTRRSIGSDAGTVEALALACERNEPLRTAVIDRGAALGAAGQLDGAGIAALTRANMGIGFHTMRHVVLPMLDDASLRHEILAGRDALEAAALRRISVFAYPHGKADARTALAVRDAGYRAAVTGQPRPIARRTDPFLLGRWEPGPLSTDELLSGIAAKLNRSA